MEPQELDVAATTAGGAHVAVDTLTVQDEDALRVVHVLHPAAGSAEGGSCERAPRLTPRQLDVLRLLAEGRPQKEIARQLWLSEATVRETTSERSSRARVTLTARGAPARQRSASASSLARRRREPRLASGINPDR